MKKLILLSGKAEHGKTSAAKILKKHLEEKGNKVIISRCAYYLKDLAAQYCGWDGNKDESGRKLLQELGTDIIRKRLNRPLFHVGRVCEDIEICQDYVDYVIIDDVRFENEIYHPKTIFGDKVVTFRINRNEYIGDYMVPYTSSLTEEQLSHPSETGLDGFKEFDYIITACNLEELEDILINVFIDNL